MDIKCAVCSKTLDSQRIEESEVMVCKKCFEICLKVTKEYTKYLSRSNFMATDIDSQGLE